MSYADELDFDSASSEVAEAILRALDAHEKTREPLNALVVWTELGRGLCGTLEEKGADSGVLGKVIARHLRDAGAVETDLGRWAYRIEPAQRMTRDELGQALRRVEEEIARAAAGLERQDPDDGGRALFVAVVKGWFPVGLRLVEALPAGRAASPAERRGALAAWCARFLPRGSDARDLGVRAVRE